MADVDGSEPAAAVETEYSPRSLSRARGRHREAVRVRASAGAVAFLSVVVFIVAKVGGMPADWLASAAMIQGELFLVAGISFQLATGRYVQAKTSRDNDELPAIQSAAERANRIYGWVLTLVPLYLAFILWFAGGLRVRTTEQVGGSDVHVNPLHWSLFAPKGSHPLWVIGILAGATVALGVVVAFFCWRTLGLEPGARIVPSRRRLAPPRLTGTVVTPETAPATGLSPRQRTSEAVETTALTEVHPDSEAAKLVVTFSGGGIRSAAFGLGAFGAVQSRPLLMSQLDATVAVSGGSYTAAALALTRTFDVHGNQHPAMPLEEMYTLDSPELAYLRRNSRYIYQPWWRTLSGVLQLVAGAFMNIFLTFAILRAFAWGLGWFLTTTGVMSGLDSSEPTFRVWPSGGWHRLVVDSPWAVPLAAIPVLLVLQAFRRARQDSLSRLSAHEPSDKRWARVLAVVSQLFVVSAFALMAVPASTVGLSTLAYRNEPTASLASVLVSLGFTRERACEDALVKEAQDAYATAVQRQALSVDPVTVSYGACGTNGKIQLPGAGHPVPAAPDAAQIRKAQSVGAKGGPWAQLGAIVTLVAAAAAMVGRALSAVPKSARRRLAGLQHALLLRTPIALLGGLALWLLLQWTFLYSTSEATRTALWSMLFVALGIFASFLNPNLTSLHEFYRERLSSAFAVGRGDDEAVQGGAVADADPDGVGQPAGDKVDYADKLPYRRRYLLSALPDRPELVICTTANVNDQRVVPTRRFGVPMTLSSKQVRLEAGSADRAIGYRLTSLIEESRDSRHLTVMGAVAMSGAAVSPLMGRMGAKTSPFRILLTLFNIRLGVWAKNPRWPMNEAPSPWWTPMATNPQFQQLVSEAFGSTEIDDRWLYLTDGGHLDNLGLVEAVRRLPDRVLVLSASNDPPGTWQDVGAAVSVIRADLGIDLQVVERDAEEDDTWLLLQAKLPKPIQVLVVRAGLSRDGSHFPPMPVDVRSFGTRDAAFPQASTGRQDFGDLEFESYRRLGQYLVERAFNATRPHFPS